MEASEIMLIEEVVLLKVYISFCGEKVRLGVRGMLVEERDISYFCVCG